MVGTLLLILCDIDYFKQFNDTYGHQRGDLCLKRVAQAIKAALKRPGDLVARYGGEEFAIILPHTSAVQAANICNNIRVALQELAVEHSASQVSPHVTLSMGIASTEPSITKVNTETLLAQSDAALYLAKQQGRDQFQIARDQQDKSSA